MAELIHRRQQRLDDLVYRLAHAQRDVLETHRRKLEIVSAAVRHYDVRRVLQGVRRELDARIAAMTSAVRTVMLENKSRLGQLSGQLEALSPLAILERGYALVFDASGKLVKDSARVDPGDEISTRLAKGSLTATVKRQNP